MTFSEALEAMRNEPGKVFTWGAGLRDYRVRDGQVESRTVLESSWALDTGWTRAEKDATDWGAV